MTTLAERMLKTGATKHSTILSDSKIFDHSDVIQTPIPILNMALSGQVDGGLTSGLTFIAGESKSFKSLLGLIMMKAYLDKYPDGICVFYDTEFGSVPAYFETLGIDTDRIVHVPVPHIEHLKFDMTKKLEELNRGDKVFMFIDSIGNIASKKEVEDALSENTASDMTRAKQLKSLFRIVTPYFTIKDIPCVAVNHTYKTQEMYSKTIMSGGTGAMYSANQVFIITKAQEKKSSELLGWNFTINIEKSRYVKEKSKFPLKVTWDKGVHKWSGLLDVALQLGYVQKPSRDWYEVINPSTGEIISDKKMQRSTIEADSATWEKLFAETDFKKDVFDICSINGNKDILGEDFD